MPLPSQPRLSVYFGSEKFALSESGGFALFGVLGGPQEAKEACSILDGVICLRVLAFSCVSCL